MDNQNESPIAALEALLFIHGEALALKKIASVLRIEKEKLEDVFLGLETELGGEKRGMILMTDAPFRDIFARKDWGDHKVQLATKPVFSKIVEDFVKDELAEELTPASLEALSLVLYLGPVPRSRIDYLRGVNSSFVLRSLMLRGLVERYPDPERPAIFLYRAAFETLKHLGIANPEELPEYAKFRELTQQKPEEEGEEERSQPQADTV